MKHLLIVSISSLFSVLFAGDTPSYYLENRLDQNNSRYSTFSTALELMNQRNAKTIVETGTARCGNTNFDGDGGSTILFSHWAQKNNASMYSVDISPSHLALARDATVAYESNIHFVLDDSVTFLKNFPLTIDFLYLDSWDYDENNPLPAQTHCLNEIKAAYDKLSKNAIIMIDDCNIPGGGKGRLALMFLKKRKWFRYRNKHQVILVRRGTHK